MRLENAEIVEMIEKITPVLESMLTGDYAIALGGSYAKGYMDAHSDLDFYIYTEGVKPILKRQAILSEIADLDHESYIDESISGTLWGGCADFYFKGMKVETSVKSIEAVQRAMEQSLNGEIFVEPTFWTLSGYYNYICLSEISFVKPLVDSTGLLTEWKKSTAVYPEKLKKAIISQFWWKSTFWLNNFHYLSAIERGDMIYASGIAQQTFHAMVQVLLALNETYYKGDKKMERQLSELALCPEPLLRELDIVLGAHRDIPLLRKQRELLMETANAIKAMMKEQNI